MGITGRDDQDFAGLRSAAILERRRNVKSGPDGGERLVMSAPLQLVDAPGPGSLRGEGCEDPYLRSRS